MSEFIRNRRSGRTTRAIDDAIQAIFAGKEVTIVDHFNSPHSNKQMFNVLMHRLASEHDFEFLVGSGLAIVNGNKLTIKLTDKWFKRRDNMLANYGHTK